MDCSRPGRFIQDLLRPVGLYLFIWPIGQKATAANARIVTYIRGAVVTAVYIVVTRSEPPDIDVHGKFEAAIFG